MKGIERLHNALSFSEEGGVPFDMGATTVSSISKIAYTRAMEFKGRPAVFEEMDEFDPVQQIVQPVEENLEFLGIDTCRTGPPRLATARPRESDETPGLFEVRDQFGCDWIFQEGKDHYFNMTTSPLKAYDSIKEGLARYSFPDFSHEKEAVVAHLERQFSHLPDRGVVLDRNCAGITEVAFRVRGYEEFFMDLALDPAGAFSLMEKILEYKLAYWSTVGDFLARRGQASRVSVAVECDDLGTQNSLLFSPAMMRELVMPLQRRLIEHVKKCIPGTKLFYHSDGAIRELIPDLIEMGVDILNPVQFSAEGMRPDELKREFGRDLVFWGGGVDTQDTLPKGSPEAVRDEVRRNIDTLAPGGGFVFAAVHNIQSDVPPENFWAMWETLMLYR
jgi:uroporphyrinogen decarboxylase